MVMSILLLNNLNLRHASVKHSTQCTFRDKELAAYKVAVKVEIVFLSRPQFDGNGAGEVESILDILNTVFTVLFLLEAILKLIAFKQVTFVIIHTLLH